MLYKKEYRFIIMGDFNAEQYEEAIMRKGETKRDKIAEELFNLLEARGLVDAFK